MQVYGLAGEHARKLAYPLLALAVRRYWGMEHLPEIRRGARGKPFFPNHPHRHFNLSHSGDWVVCALSDAPVGVDIQRIRPVRPALLHRVCNQEELSWYTRRGSAAEDFALLWAMKESCCKHSGQGLVLPPSRIEVPLPGEGKELTDGEGLRFYPVEGEGWRFCLCTTQVWDGEMSWVKPGDILNLKHEETDR